MTEYPVTVKCSRCKSSKFSGEILEEHIVLSSYEVVSGVLTEEVDSAEAKSSGRVVAVCVCGHSWTLRKVFRIDSLIEWS